MRTLAALLLGTLVMSGCGGGDTETVTVGAGETDTATSETNTEGSNLDPVTGPITARTVKACLEDGGAEIQKTGGDLGGEGEGVFAFGPQGSQIGIAIANNAAVGKELADQLAATGDYEVNRVPDNPEVVALFQGKAEPEDRALVDKCVGGGE